MIYCVIRFSLIWQISVVKNDIQTSAYNTSKPQENAAIIHQCYGFCQALTDSREWNFRPTTVSAHQTRRETSRRVRQSCMWPCSLAVYSALSCWISLKEMRLKNSQHGQKCFVSLEVKNEVRREAIIQNRNFNNSEWRKANSSNNISSRWHPQPDICRDVLTYPHN